MRITIANTSCNAVLFARRTNYVDQSSFVMALCCCFFFNNNLFRVGLKRRWLILRCIRSMYEFENCEKNYFIVRSV